MLPLTYDKGILGFALYAFATMRWDAKIPYLKCMGTLSACFFHPKGQP